MAIDFGPTRSMKARFNRILAVFLVQDATGCLNPFDTAHPLYRLIVPVSLPSILPLPLFFLFCEKASNL